MGLEVEDKLNKETKIKHGVKIKNKK